MNDNADDFSEPKSDDGEVVATEPQGWHTNEETAERGKETTCKQGCKESGLGLPSGCGRQNRRKRERDDARCVSSCGHETGVAKRELAGVAVHQIEAHCEDDIDAGQHKDVHRVIVQLRRDGIESHAGSQTSSESKVCDMLLHGIRLSRARISQGVRLA